METMNYQTKYKNRTVRVLILLSVVLMLVIGMHQAVYAAKLSDKKLILCQGESQRLRLKGASGAVEWKSGNPNVAQVGEKGLVQALRPGRCRIQAVCGGSTYSCKVIVQAIAFSKPALTMVCGRKYKLEFNSEKVTGAVWSSSEPGIAGVRDGVVTSISAGTAVITAKWNGISLKCTVTVKDNSLENLKQAYPAVKANRGKIVLAGSSSMDYWGDAQQAFAPYDVINTAIGGTTVSQWLVWYRTLITRYKPAAVVLYAGSNDLGNGESISGEKNAENTILLLKRISKKLKNTPVFYISINPCWARKGAWKKVSASNTLVKNFCDRKKNLYYIDIVSAFADQNGTPNPACFLADQLHPSEKGYKIWDQLIANQVKQLAGKSLRKAQKQRQKKA